MDHAENERMEHHTSHRGHEHDPEGDGPVVEPASQMLSEIGNAGMGRILGDGGVQRSGATSEQQLDETVSRTIEERRGKGAPLDEPVRREMEGALGHDLSDVTVHTDGQAHELNEAVSARAFTTGNDVFFKQGTYDPGSSDGRHLLAHELTHVVQQREGTSGLDAGEVSDPSDNAEVEAEHVGAQVASGETPAAAAAAAGDGVARQAEEEEEELQMSAEPGVQRQGEEEEEELQMSAEPGVQRQGEEEEEELQMSAEPGVQRAPDEDEDALEG